MFTTLALRGRGYEGPSVQQQSRLKEPRRAAACSQEEKKIIIMRTWPSLYDGSRTFSGDQSFFISSQRVTNSRCCVERMHGAFMVPLHPGAVRTKAANPRYNLLSSRFFFHSNR